jgi:hypothetical protein
MDPLIYGETLNTKEKLETEVQEFHSFYDQLPAPKQEQEALREFISKKFWRNNAADIRAFLFYSELTIFSPPLPQTIFDQYSNTPEGKRERIAEKYYQGQGLTGTMSEEQYKEIQHWDSVADEKVKISGQSTNSQERRQRDAEVILAHKKYLEALGLRPCAARDCVLFVTNPRRKYCSDHCAQKERPRQWRAKNPDAKKLADMHYLTDAHKIKPFRKKKKKSTKKRK